MRLVTVGGHGEGSRLDGPSSQPARRARDCADFVRIRHVGEDNVLWGTDSIWYGSPQDQIQAFRTFQITAPLIEEHGYPELTSELRAKVFGLNGAAVYGVDPPAQRKKAESDPIARRKTAYLDQAEPAFETYGPKTDREFDALQAERGGLPV